MWSTWYLSSIHSYFCMNYLPAATREHSMPLLVQFSVNIFSITLHSHKFLVIISVLGIYIKPYVLRMCSLLFFATWLSADFDSVIWIHVWLLWTRYCYVSSTNRPKNLNNTFLKNCNLVLNWTELNQTVSVRPPHPKAWLRPLIHIGEGLEPEGRRFIHHAVSERVTKHFTTLCLLL